MSRTSILYFCLLALVLNLVGSENAWADKKSKKKQPSTEPNILIRPMPNKLVFGSSIQKERKEALNESISILYTLPMAPQNLSAVGLTKVLRLKELTPTHLQQWLERRVRFVVNSDFKIDSHLVVVQESYDFPYADQIPDVLRQSEGLTQGAAKEDSDSGVMMSNLSSAIYFFGKSNKVLVGVDLDLGMPVPVTSPRVGVLQIGPALFQNFAGDGKKTQNVLNDIVHTGTLFHEARHSDGHGVTLGFFHATCPKESDYAGLPACDLALNGPYAVGALMTKALVDSCEKCTPQTQRVLNMIFLDYASRLLAPQKAPPHLSPGAGAGVEWDDAPEGQLVN